MTLRLSGLPGYSRVQESINSFYPEIRELQRSIENMRYFLKHGILCRSTVHDQSADICIFRDNFGSFGFEIQNLKNRLNFKFYVSC